MGITPDIIVLRCDEPITDESIFRKIANFCNVKPDCVIENLTLPVLYEAPLFLEKAQLSSVVCRELHLTAPEPDLSECQTMVAAIKSRSKTVTIGLVGKYVQLHDAYLSVAEALRHAGFALDSMIDIRWIDSETITEATKDEVLSGLDGIIVPGGFGDRGIEGMILAAQYARENHIPYFGICLGMQIAVIEYARHVLGIADANSGEFAPKGEHKVIDFMPGQSDEIDKGGTLRLGSYPCVIAEGTTMERCYGQTLIYERHRHRYEFNNDYRDVLCTAGLTLSGLSPDGRLVETVELTDRSFHVGVQYHPEFKSRPNRPHPLFKGFIAAALEDSNDGHGYNRKFILEAGEEYCGVVFGYTGGNSAVIDPLGEPLTLAGETEAIVSASLNMQTLEKIRDRIPVFRDRRPELYHFQEQQKRK